VAAGRAGGAAGAHSAASSFSRTRALRSRRAARQPALKCSPAAGRAAPDLAMNPLTAMPASWLPSGRCAAPYPAISALSARMLMRRGMPPAASAISQGRARRHHLGHLAGAADPQPVVDIVEAFLDAESAEPRPQGNALI